MTTEPAPFRRRRTMFHAGPVAAIAMFAAVAVSAPASALVPAALVPTALVPAAAADNGQRSFGVQPSGPKKPDPRPNFTYRNVKPGQRLFDHVAIVNISTRPVTLTVYAADAYNTQSGAFDLLPQKKPSTDLGSWVKLRSRMVTVPARSSLITPIQVTVPRNAEPGDHAGGIVASLRTMARDKKGNSVTVEDRVGTRVYIRVTGKLTPKLSMTQASATYRSKNPLVPGDADVTYTIRNDGNVRLIGTKTIRVSDLFGGSKRAINVPDMPELLPGSSFTFTTTVPKVRPGLLLTARTVVDPRSVTGNVDPALAQVSASTRFWAPYWPLVVLLVLVLAGGAGYWRRHRRRPSGPGSGAQQGSGPRPDPAGSVARPTPDAKSGVLVQRARRVERAATRRQRLVLAGLAGLFIVAGPLSASSTAQAAGSGALTFMPGRGMDISPLYVVPSAACPKAATNVIGRMYGQGFPKEGIVVIPNGDAGVKHEGTFGLPLQDTIAGFAAQYGTKLSGAYQVVLQCVPRLGVTVYAQYSGTITFGDATHYTAPQPAKVPDAGVPIGFLAQVFPEYKQAVPGTAPSVAAQGPVAAPAPAPVQETGRQGPGDQSTSATPFLVIGGAAVALGGAGFLATRRPSRSAPSAAGSTTSWPDDEPPVTEPSEAGRTGTEQSGTGTTGDEDAEPRLAAAHPSKETH